MLFCICPAISPTGLHDPIRQSPSKETHALFVLIFSVAQRPESDSKISDDVGDDIGLMRIVSLIINQTTSV